MKTRYAVPVALLAGLTLLLAFVVSAHGSRLEPGPASPRAPQATPALNLHQPNDPMTLDPGQGTDAGSHNVVEQLFLGLVDLDDATAEVRPELATGWTVSPDGTVYTFTLRSDVRWTDGRPVTAEDVRYGILRSLDPAFGAGYAYTLYVIRNAGAYNAGTLTDTAAVGVAVLDDAHLRISLEYPAAYALSILSMPVARPVPRQAVEAWGNAWALPGHIVTNGPYRLAEWVYADHILLEKNPDYYAAADVQIERVKLWTVDDATAWQMYLDGRLDSTDVLPGFPLDPARRGEVHVQPIASTYYYGFSLSQPPFDKALVRKAFSAAVDRQGLVDTMGGVPRPALTFAPPGVFGHVDGYAEGVGIPYNPTQAREWLAQAGYPGGQGLPAVTLWYNEEFGHGLIADYIRRGWSSTLGVSVTLQSLAWPTYLAQVGRGDWQVWRLGWGMDYPDAINFLSDAIDNAGGAFGGWNNPEYRALVGQAAREVDPAARKALYKQAERILVEDDAVMIPLFYSASAIATRPYLQRTYPGSGFDISTWRLGWRALLPVVTRGR